MKVAMVKHKPYGKVFWFEIPDFAWPVIQRVVGGMAP